MHVATFNCMQEVGDKKKFLTKTRFKSDRLTTTDYDPESIRTQKVKKFN